MLQVFSQFLDDGISAGKPPPRRILDAGCGTGVIGICAAAAAASLGQEAHVRCQDRDELARLVTLHNAAKNNIPPAALEAYAEPLLAGSPAAASSGEGWDLILSNIPAKAGEPVLEDFVRRSASLLTGGGRAIIVVVHTLADFFRAQIAAAGADLLLEKTSPGHSVFVYGRAGDSASVAAAFAAATAATIAASANTDSGFLLRYPSYRRGSAQCVIEDIPVSIETIHGAAGFDAPGGAVLAAAKLASRLGLEKLPAAAPLLIHEPSQGFFPRWLLKFLHREGLKLDTPLPEQAPAGWAARGRRKFLGLPAVGDEPENSKTRRTIDAARQDELDDHNKISKYLKHETQNGAGQRLRRRTPPDFAAPALPTPPGDFQNFCGSSSDTGRTLVFSGRNILALEAARHNVPQAVIVPAADLHLGSGALLAAAPHKYALIAAFPELLPQSALPKAKEGRPPADQLASLWDSLPPLLAEGGTFLAAFGSSDAERFDRKKPQGYSRLGSIKRNGFRALAYRYE